MSKAEQLLHERLKRISEGKYGCGIKSVNLVNPDAMMLIVNPHNGNNRQADWC
ncbi:MAG: hypothetical protein ACE5I5_09075 [Candidatus Heimdallarchaeota archaeon]